MLSNYLRMLVWAAGKNLTEPVSSRSMRPFSGLIPVQFPVNFLPLQVSVILWLRRMLRLVHRSITFSLDFCAVSSQ